MYPPQAPWTGLGQLENQISSIKSELNGKANSHEFHSLNSKVDSLERECREIRSEINGVFYRLQELENYRIEQQQAAVNQTSGA